MGEEEEEWVVGLGGWLLPGYIKDIKKMFLVISEIVERMLYFVRGVVYWKCSYNVPCCVKIKS